MSITLDDILEINNGAKYYNTDLHIHTFGASNCVEDTNMTPENIIKKASDNNISIISITDHNTDKNIEKSLDLAKTYNDDILVIPGVEITTSHGHLLVYFPPDEYHKIGILLAKIDIIESQGNQDVHTHKSMTEVINEVDILDGISVAAHIDRENTGFEMIVTGYPSWKKDIITSQGLFGIEFDDITNINWYSENDINEDGNNRKNIFRERSKISSLKGRSNIAHLQGSDAHSLDEFVEKNINKGLTRLKLNEFTFDSFRTAFIDSDARVLTKALLPKSMHRIVGMSISGGFLDGEIYHFNNNLNCFIGGRGTGKSTAIRSLAYGLDVDDDFSQKDNCPDNVIIYCQDANGIHYKYERSKGTDVNIKAKEDESIIDVPSDAFQIEYYPQGSISEIAKDPLKNPILLQQFLDKHINLSELQSKEQELISNIKQNGAQLIPIESIFTQLPKKESKLKDLNKKIKIAEEGKLKELAEFQNKLNAEKNLVSMIQDICICYENGISLKPFNKDYQSLLNTVGDITNMRRSDEILDNVKNIIEKCNKYLTSKESEINTFLKENAQNLTDLLSSIKSIHKGYDEKINEKTEELKEKGLTANIFELQRIFKEKDDLVREISFINSKKAQLMELRKFRDEYLEELNDIRIRIMRRRSDQLSLINRNLKSIIKDYSVYIRYDISGIIDDFKSYILETMQGSYFSEEQALLFCSKITPDKLASYVKSDNIADLSKETGVEGRWCRDIISKFKILEKLHKLEILWKQPAPIISVKTIETIQKEIPINQLSDGQKHTILLTIVMMSESNLPLIIDQPEDDLDNVFISNSVVSILRKIKDKRQVVLVTHNANMAVLGDAELIFPMKQVEYKGQSFDRGSIDKSETQNAAQDILEGGELAFKRRKEIYGY